MFRYCCEEKLNACETDTEILYRLIKGLENAKEQESDERGFLINALLLLRAMEDIGRNILENSSYIPLRIIAQEITEERQETEKNAEPFFKNDKCQKHAGNQESAGSKKNKRRTKRLMRSIACEKNEKQHGDKARIALLLKLQKALIKNASGALKSQTGDEEFTLFVKSLLASWRSRKRKLDYLLQAQK